jgi:hypothetical protein
MRPDWFWKTLVRAAGYYAQYLSRSRAPSAQIREVVDHGRLVQRRLGLPVNNKLETLNTARTAAVPARRRGTFR